MTDEANDLLIEQACSAFRERDVSGRILPSPAWCDLAPQAREELFEQQIESRLLERAVDPQGFSATVRAVLNRLAIV